jgi:hypothetical protein
MAERRHYMCKSPWLEHAVDFRDRHFGIPHVLEHRIAFNASEYRVPKWQPLHIGNDIHARNTEQIEVYVTLRSRARTSHVQIVRSERGVNPQLVGIVHERSRRPQPGEHPHRLGAGAERRTPVAGPRRSFAPPVRGPRLASAMSLVIVPTVPRTSRCPTMRRTMILTNGGEPGRYVAAAFVNEHCVDGYRRLCTVAGTRSTPPVSQRQPGCRVQGYG